MAHRLDHGLYVAKEWVPQQGWRTRARVWKCVRASGHVCVSFCWGRAFKQTVPLFPPPCLDFLDANAYFVSASQPNMVHFLHLILCHVVSFLVSFKTTRRVPSRKLAGSPESTEVLGMILLKDTQCASVIRVIPSFLLRKRQGIMPRLNFLGRPFQWSNFGLLPIHPFGSEIMPFSRARFC